jgi:hypothetical protein
VFSWVNACDAAVFGIALQQLDRKTAQRDCLFLGEEKVDTIRAGVPGDTGDGRRLTTVLPGLPTLDEIMDGRRPR